MEADAEIRKLTAQLQQWRETKRVLTDQLFANHDKPLLTWDGKKFKFCTSNVSSPLTFRHLETCLSQRIKNPEQVQILLQYIKEQRPTHVVREVKQVP